MEKEIKAFREQMRITKELTEQHQKQQEQGMDLINTVLDSAPEEDKAEMQLLKAKINMAINDVKKGKASGLKELEKLTKQMTQKYSK